MEKEEELREAYFKTIKMASATLEILCLALNMKGMSVLWRVIFAVMISSPQTFERFSKAIVEFLKKESEIEKMKSEFLTVDEFLSAIDKNKIN